MKFCSVSCVILYSCCAPGRSILSNSRRGWKWVTHVFKTRNDSDLPAPFCEGAGVLYIAIKTRNELWHFNNVLFGSLLLLMAMVQTLFLVFPAQTHSSPSQDTNPELCWSQWEQESPGQIHNLDGYMCWIPEWKQCSHIPGKGKEIAFLSLCLRPEMITVYSPGFVFFLLSHNFVFSLWQFNFSVLHSA